MWTRHRVRAVGTPTPRGPPHNKADRRCRRSAPSGPAQCVSTCGPHAPVNESILSSRWLRRFSTCRSCCHAPGRDDRYSRRTVPSTPPGLRRRYRRDEFTQPACWGFRYGDAGPRWLACHLNLSHASEARRHLAAGLYFSLRSSSEGSSRGAATAAAARCLRAPGHLGALPLPARLRRPRRSRRVPTPPRCSPYCSSSSTNRVGWSACWERTRRA